MTEVIPLLPIFPIFLKSFIESKLGMMASIFQGSSVGTDTHS